ncbi:hypothetical protein NKH70_07985 [Mesorhizobium sp. M0991]|uniref:hypothetical protein n=1 Tax=unclassified Mesorhizobium TaxID=325217 RepID=UPI00333AD62C
MSTVAERITHLPSALTKFNLVVDGQVEMDGLNRRRFNSLSWWQWLLLLSMLVCVVVLRHLPYLHISDPAYLFNERLGAIIASVVLMLVVPYGIAWGIGRLADRSRGGFLWVLWSLATIMFILNLGLLATCPTCL